MRTPRQPTKRQRAREALVIPPGARLIIPASEDEPEMDVTDFLVAVHGLTHRDPDCLPRALGLPLPTGHPAARHTDN